MLDELLNGCFAAGDRTDPIGEPARLYHRDIAELASATQALLGFLGR